MESKCVIVLWRLVVNSNHNFKWWTVLWCDRYCHCSVWLRVYRFRPLENNNLMMSCGAKYHLRLSSMCVCVCAALWRRKKYKLLKTHKKVRRAFLDRSSTKLQDLLLMTFMTWLWFFLRALCRSVCILSSVLIAPPCPIRSLDDDDDATLLLALMFTFGAVKRNSQWILCVFCCSVVCIGIRLCRKGGQQRRKIRYMIRAFLKNWKKKLFHFFPINTNGFALENGICVQFLAAESLL